MSNWLGVEKRSLWCAATQSVAPFAAMNTEERRIRKTEQPYCCQEARRDPVQLDSVLSILASR